MIAEEFFIDDIGRISKDDSSVLQEIEYALENNEFLKNINVKEYEERKVEIYRASRPEYRKALVDVRLNAKITFYKWVIDEFYIQIGNKEKAEEILKIVFGKNEDDGSISRTFDKLKYDRGKREWNTFKHLFQNELHDKELMDLLIYLTKQELHIEDFEWNIVKINEAWLKGSPAMKSQLTPPLLYRKRRLLSHATPRYQKERHQP